MVFRAPGAVPVTGGGFFGQGGVESAMGGVRVFGPTGRDQTYTPQGEPTFRTGGGAKGGGKGVGVPGAGVGRVRFEEVAGAGDGLEAAGKGGVQDPLPVGPLLSRRDQALNALKVLEEEERMAKVQGELQGVKDQIKALFKEEEERKERRRREEENMEDDAFVEEAGTSEEVGVRVEVGKRRKVARQGRFACGRVASGGGRRGGGGGEGEMWRR